MTDLPEGWDEFDDAEDQPVTVDTDPVEGEALVGLERFFEEHSDRVFYSRQLEVLHEDRWFHWVTNRALRIMAAGEILRSEVRPLATGGSVTLYWHRTHRYPRRQAQQIVSLVNEYSDPNLGHGLGAQGEYLVHEGIAKRGFLTSGRNTREFDGRAWYRSDHDLDFIFQRDGVAYGVEVKNRLHYIEREELETKMAMCEVLGLRPVFAVRMLPKHWINEVREAGGFSLIFKYQLYPPGHRDLAKRVREGLGLPVDSPRSLQDGTIDRFEKWHRGLVNSAGNSHEPE